MKRWLKKIAVVTGAGSGIGAAVYKDLAKNGLVTIGLDRSADTVEEIKCSLPPDQSKRAHAYSCDVTDEESVCDTFECILDKFKAVDILVNNAGLLLEGRLTSMPCSEMKRVMDTNVMGIIYCTQHAFKSMVDRKFNGHIININSILGHSVPALPPWNTYPSSKHAVTALCEMYRQEFNQLGVKVKITSISPGVVNTNMVKDYAETFVHMVKPEDISAGIMYALSTPPHVQVYELCIKPIGEVI